MELTTKQATAIGAVALLAIGWGAGKGSPERPDEVPSAPVVIEATTTTTTEPETTTTTTAPTTTTTAPEPTTTTTAPVVVAPEPEIEEPIDVDAPDDADRLAEELGCQEDEVPILVLGDVVPYDDPRVPEGDNLFWATDYGLAGQRTCIPADDLNFG